MRSHDRNNEGTLGKYNPIINLLYQCIACLTQEIIYYFKKNILFSVFEF